MPDSKAFIAVAQRAKRVVRRPPGTHRPEWCNIYPQSLLPGWSRHRTVCYQHQLPRRQAAYDRTSPQVLSYLSGKRSEERVHSGNSRLSQKGGWHE